MSVWKSDEKLLIFASLISPSKIILFEKQYQAFDTVFHLVMKQCVSCLIYNIKVWDSVIMPVYNSEYHERPLRQQRSIIFA